ncbi:MAG: hypothetical protein D6806_01930, partial [Deltaproteobacteria bacterium]
MTGKKAKGPPDTNPSIGDDEPELVSDEDIVALDSDQEQYDPAEDEPTGKLVVPPEFRESREGDDFAGLKKDDDEVDFVPEENFSPDDTGPLMLDETDFEETGEEDVFEAGGEPDRRQGSDGALVDDPGQNESLMWEQDSTAEAEFGEEEHEEEHEDTGEEPDFAGDEG